MKIMPYHTINTSTPVDIFLMKGILDDAGEIIRAYNKGQRAVIVTDENVAPLYAKRLLDGVRNAGFECNIIGIESGESNKNINIVINLYKEFNEKSITRSDIIISLGGGVVGDITGFAASTYMRGIPYIQVPTTLLAQIDSSIGGKTGVDLPYGKNLAGTFYQPKAIIIDTDTIKTLPKEYYNDGIAEVIKYGFISDHTIIDTLSFDYDEIGFIEMIKKCVNIKSKIVEQDEKENNIRMILNFGHTYGHAIEKAMNYQGIRHGEAVGIGMIKAMEIGIHKNITSIETKEKLLSLLDKFNLPKNTNISNKALCDAICSDKKREADKINFILINEIGKAIITKISIEELRGLKL